MTQYINRGFQKSLNNSIANKMDVQGKLFDYFIV